MTCSQEGAPMYPTNHRSPLEVGFTLIELMVVVLIIGILSALAVPEISEAMKNRRMTDAAVRVQSLYRGARGRALGRGLAQMVRYEAIGTSARLRHFEGDSNSCSASNWLAIVGTAGTAPATYRDMLVDQENFSLVGSLWQRNGIVLNRLSSTGGAGGSDGALVDLCFTPLGRVFYRTNAGLPFGEPPAGRNGYQLRIERLDLETGTKVGVPRYVVVPTSGTPRIQVQGS